MAEQLTPVPREADAATALPLSARARRRADRPRPSLARGLLRTARPHQWVKNVLVVAAPGAAGVLTQPRPLLTVALAFVSFCLVSSGTYLLNDASDVEADRRHPTKRERPVAAGIVPAGVAVAAGIALLCGAFLVALAIGIPFLGAVAGYVALTTSYTLWLKHVAVLDLGAVAGGFFIRAIAGGVATGVPFSRWFLIVAAFGSLFMVAGKRHGEHIDLGEQGAGVRATLAQYPRDYLRYVWTLASGVTLAAYCLWAFEQAEASAGAPWFELSIIPFVLGILRYALLLEQGRGSAPEEIVLGDRTLQAIGLVWVTLFACGVYLGR